MRLGAPRKAADGRHERPRADVVTGRKVALTGLPRSIAAMSVSTTSSTSTTLTPPLGASGSPSLSAVWMTRATEPRRKDPVPTTRLGLTLMTSMLPACSCAASSASRFETL